MAAMNHRAARIGKTWCIHPGLIEQATGYRLHRCISQYSTLTFREKERSGFCSLRHWKQFPNLFMAPLPTAVCSKKKGWMCVPLGIRIPIANSCIRWCYNFKGSHRMGNGRIFQKSLRGFFFNKYNQMNLVSAGSISLESTFNQTKNNGEGTSEAYCRFLYTCTAKTANGMSDNCALGYSDIYFF
jgi:hypothetical protein